MLHRLGIRGKVLAALAVPVLVLFGAASIISWQAISAANVAGAVDALIGTTDDVGAFTQALQTERRESLALAQDPAAGTAALEAARAATDLRAARLESAMSSIDVRPLGPGVLQSVSQTRLARQSLPALRKQVDGALLPGKVIDSQYSSIIGFHVEQGAVLADALQDRELASRLNAYCLVNRSGEGLARELPEALRLIADGRGDPAAVLELAPRITFDTDAYTQARTALAQVRLSGIRLGSLADAYVGQRLVLSSGSASAVTAIDPTSYQENSLGALREITTVRDKLGARNVAMAAGNEQRAVQRATATIIATLVAVLLSVLIALLVVREIVVPLRRLTKAVGDVREQLPLLVEQVLVPGEGPQFSLTQIPVTSTDELGALAGAFNAVNATTIQVAQQQAALRGSIAEMFVNVARRDQILLNRQISFIDELERTEEDPGILSSLFRLDHLATRMRRNAESLLVLAGIESGRRMRESMPLSDVVRTAASEIEQYDRIQLDVGADPLMFGFSSLAAAHLLAELLENATVFSEPGTPVEVVTSTDGGYLQVVVRDHGLGMSDAELAVAQGKIHSSAAGDVFGAQRLGFYVVGRLAARLDTQVTLAQSPDGLGTLAIVRFPVSMFEAPAAEPVDLDALTDGETSGGLPRRRAHDGDFASGTLGADGRAIVLPKLIEMPLSAELSVPVDRWVPPTSADDGGSLLPSRRRSVVQREEPFDDPYADFVATPTPLAESPAEGIAADRSAAQESAADESPIAPTSVVAGPSVESSVVGIPAESPAAESPAESPAAQNPAAENPAADSPADAPAPPKPLRKGLFAGFRGRAPDAPTSPDLPGDSRVGGVPVPIVPDGFAQAALAHLFTVPELAPDGEQWVPVFAFEDAAHGSPEHEMHPEPAQTFETAVAAFDAHAVPEPADADAHAVPEPADVDAHAEPQPAAYRYDSFDAGPADFGDYAVPELAADDSHAVPEPVVYELSPDVPAVEVEPAVEPTSAHPLDETHAPGWRGAARQGAEHWATDWSAQDVEPDSPAVTWESTSAAASWQQAEFVEPAHDADRVQAEVPGSVAESAQPEASSDDVVSERPAAESAPPEAASLHVVPEYVRRGLFRRRRHAAPVTEPEDAQAAEPVPGGPEIVKPEAAPEPSAEVAEIAETAETFEPVSLARLFELARAAELADPSPVAEALPARDEALDPRPVAETAEPAPVAEVLEPVAEVDAAPVAAPVAGPSAAPRAWFRQKPKDLAGAAPLPANEPVPSPVAEIIAPAVAEEPAPIPVALAPTPAEPAHIPPTPPAPIPVAWAPTSAAAPAAPAPESPLPVAAAEAPVRHGLFGRGRRHAPGPLTPPPTSGDTPVSAVPPSKTSGADRHRGTRAAAPASAAPQPAVPAVPRWTPQRDILEQQPNYRTTPFKPEHSPADEQAPHPHVEAVPASVAHHDAVDRSGHRDRAGLAQVPTPAPEPAPHRAPSLGALDDGAARMLALRSDIQEQALAELGQLVAYRPSAVAATPDRKESLQRRVPVAIPGAIASPDSAVPTERDADQLRARLSKFQAGTNRGRFAAEVAAKTPPAADGEPSSGSGVHDQTPAQAL